MQDLDINWAKPIPIHIAMDLGQGISAESKQPTLYGVDKASYKAFESGRFVGDTRRGGTCNFGDVKINPHLNGTHTECGGHITLERRFVTDINTFTPKLGLLITVPTVSLLDSGESYTGERNDHDQVITAESIRTSLDKDVDYGKPDALVVRSTPNENTKKNRDYTSDLPPYFTTDAISLLNTYGFNHILTDLPSVDRTDDGGLLDNHHRYFGYVRKSLDTPKYPYKTITELIYVSNEVPDGIYALMMNVAQWELDAAPAYPVLFPIRKKA